MIFPTGRLTQLCLALVFISTVFVVAAIAFRVFHLMGCQAGGRAVMQVRNVESAHLYLRRHHSDLTAIDFMRLAQQSHDDGRYADSCDECSKALQINSQYTPALGLRADVYRHLGQYANEIDDCNNAMKVAPHYAEFYSLRGWANCKTGKIQEGIADANKALQLQPNNNDAFATLGLAQYLLNNYDESIGYLSKAMSLDPQDPENYGIRSLVYARQGKSELSKQDHNKALELHYLQKL